MCSSDTLSRELLRFPTYKPSYSEYRGVFPYPLRNAPSNMTKGEAW